MTWEDTDGAVDIPRGRRGHGCSCTGAHLKCAEPGHPGVAGNRPDPPCSPEGRAEAHKTQGIGAGVVPETLDTPLSIDEAIAIEDEEAFGGRGASGRP